MTKLFSYLFVIIWTQSVFSMEVSENPNYLASKADFFDVLSKINLKDWSMTNEVWPLSQNPNLKTDVVHIKNLHLSARKLLVMSSGLHGVEAQVGSRIQNNFLQKFILKNKLSNLEIDYSFLHVLNPWGFANNRRVNADNIDLNRNFVIQESDFKVINTEYSKIDQFLNPKTDLNLNFIHRPIFILDSIYYIFKYSIESLRKTILFGQYQNEYGIYYGGNQYSELKLRIDQFVDQVCSKYQEIIWIDLHSGYGERGRLHLLAGLTESENSKNIKKLLPDQKIDFAQAKKFYQTSGDLLSYVGQKIGEKKFTGLVFEFGTMDSQKSMGSIESLRRMVVENQSYFKNINDLNRKNAEALFLDMFNPIDENWINKIELQSDNLIEMILIHK